MHSSISDALELYIRLKGAGRDRVFAKTSARNVGYLIESIGDVDLSSIKSVNASLRLRLDVSRRYGIVEKIE